VIRRSQIIDLCFYGSLIAVGGALLLKFSQMEGSGTGRSSFALISPVFFTMAAKKGSHLGIFALALALLGLLFALIALWAGFST